jgi:hypothetical protein
MRGIIGVGGIIISVIACSPAKTSTTSDEVVVPGQEGKPRPAAFLGRGVLGRAAWNGLTLGQTPAPWLNATRMPLPPSAVVGATGGLGATDAADTVLSDDRDIWNPCFCADIGPRRCAIRKYTPGDGTNAGRVDPAQRDDGQPPCRRPISPRCAT